MPPVLTAQAPSSLRTACTALVAALRVQATPCLDPETFPCFAPAALASDPNLGPESLAAVLAELSVADIPTLERAIAAIDGNQQAWLGFKIVTDPVAAVDSEDTEVVARRGSGMGSADGRCGLFLVINPDGARDGAELVFSRPYSQRDRMQMLDITRGPQMHDEQYAGVAWKSVPLFRSGRVFILGAGTVGAQVELLANRVGFGTVVVDFDPGYLNADRFPRSERILVAGFETLPDLGIGPDDYVCVLTRGHMHDPEALVYGIRAGAGYVGMMGCAEKNERVFQLAERSGLDQAALRATHTPIGLKFGAQSPAELAVSVVAELIQVRQQRRSAQPVSADR